MKTFITKIIYWSLFIVSLHVVALFFADGYFNSNYRRLTSGRQGNLIIGTSRAAQGIVPAVISEEQGREYYNYAFNIGVSPFGKVYIDAIKGKLDTTNLDQHFIIAVDPWSLSSPRITKLDFPEENMLLGQIDDFSSATNIKALREINNKGWGDMIVKSFKTRLIKFVFDHKEHVPNKFHSFLPNGYSYLHGDGWLEIRLKSNEASYLQKRERQKLKAYRHKSELLVGSELRLSLLGDLIDYLSSFGKVTLVRMPISNSFEELESLYWIDFDAEINLLCTSRECSYLNFQKDSVTYDYSDGNHLLNSDAIVFSGKLKEYLP